MKEISVKSKKQLQLIDITDKVKNSFDIEDGFVSVFVPHTTAAVTVQEPDRDLWKDLLNTYRRLVPLERDYKHNVKYSGTSGEQNAHAHILSSLVKPSVEIPVEKGKPILGTWQSILFVELDGPRNRKVKIKSVSSK